MSTYRVFAPPAQSDDDDNETPVFREEREGDSCYNVGAAWLNDNHAPQPVVVVGPAVGDESGDIVVVLRRGPRPGTLYDVLNGDISDAAYYVDDFPQQDPPDGSVATHAPE